MKIEFLCTLVILFLTVLNAQCKKSRDKSRGSNSGKRRRHKTIADVIEDACMPKRTDRLVYRFSNDTHIYMAFDVLSECTVYSMSWEFRKGNNDFLQNRGHAHYDRHPSSEVRKLPKHYLLAAAGQRQQRLLQKIVSEDCQVSITATSCLMEALARTAQKMKEVEFGGKCRDAQRPPSCHNTELLTLGGGGAQRR